MKLSLAQKCLLCAMFGLILLMITFSLMAMKDKTHEGYIKCVEEKCDKQGEFHCQKLRELINCCEGAGGEEGREGDKFKCVFH